MSEKRKRAKHLLWHYVELAIQDKVRDPYVLRDAEYEVKEIVDSIIAAVKEELQGGGGE